MRRAVRADGRALAAAAEELRSQKAGGAGWGWFCKGNRIVGWGWVGLGGVGVGWGWGWWGGNWG